MESMPVWLQYLMKVISPTPHFVTFAQNVLYRGADFPIVWPEILATTAIGWSAPVELDRSRGGFDHLPSVVILELRGAEVAERGM